MTDVQIDHLKPIFNKLERELKAVNSVIERYEEGDANEEDVKEAILNTEILQEI